MILVTVTHKQGIELATPYDLAIDPEKIVSTRVRDGHCELDYAETFDRNREEITYEVTAAKPNIDATITGEYTTHVYLSLVVYWADNKDLIPFPAISSTYTLYMQEKYIVDIQDVPFELYWKNQKISTTLRRVRFVPGAFKQEVIYVTNALNDLVDNTPSDTTTTSTAVPVTTTTTPIPATTTTTTWGGCFDWVITNLDQQIPAVFRIYPCGEGCQEEFVLVEYGSPVSGCYCYEPEFVNGGEMYSVVRGRSCEATTTTTECLPDGIPLNLATSITPVLGGETLAFQASEENACSALWYVTNEEEDWTINWFDGKVVPGQPNVWWDARTCELLDGWYMVWDDGYKIYWFSSGIQGTLLECTTTTTEVGTTTTTEILVPSDIRLKKNIKFAGNHVGGHPEFTWEWNDEAIRLGFNKYPTKGVLAQEVMKTNPEAVKMGKDGYYKVNYKKL